MLKTVVLVVDDEPIILRLCSVAIAEAGFRPVVAENGIAGLEVFMQLKDEICLVLTDIVMPAVNGIEMAANILQIEPQTKILLMSGYSDDVIKLQGKNGFPFVRKPFIHAILIEKIKSLVGTSDRATGSGM
jgi:two-component system cell cycle sensor histidine kinase/response regulator CckA